MEKTVIRREILAALRARLALEVGLGVDYLGGALDPAALEAALKGPMTVNSRTADNPQRSIRPVLAEERGGSPSSGSFRPQPIARAQPARTIPPPTMATRARTSSLVPFSPISGNPEKEALLDSLRNEAMGCRECGLCEKRNSVVWGEGSLDASVMFIGEGPGRDEDMEGRPFVGRSGRLLTDIIEKGMKVPRGEVYIANVVKCRPPGNRDPRPEEVAACSRYLKTQIQVIAPRVIVAVGGVAGCALLNLPPKSPGLRGRWHQYQEIPMRVIFHPSYLLRQRRSANDRTQADRDTWSDIQEVMRKIS